MKTTFPAGRNERPLKIIYLMQSLHFPGGMERVLTTKVNYMASELGYDITIVTTDGKGQPAYFALDPAVKRHELDINFNQLWSKSFKEKTILYLKLQRQFKKEVIQYLLDEQADIVISGLRREINFLHKIKDGSVKIGECHENREYIRETNQLPTAGFFKRQFIQYRVRDLINHVKKIDAFVVLTDTDVPTWPELNNVVVKNNPSSFKVEKFSDCTKKSVVALIRYHKVKGIERMIETWGRIAKKHPDWHLNVYGQGNKEAYQVHVDKQNLQDFITLHGPTDNVQEVLQQSSAYLMTSLQEAWGLVMIEAMATGVPVLAFDCPYGPRHIVIDGQNGFLVQDGDINTMAERLDQILSDDDMRQAMGKQAIIDAERFSVENICKEWQELFNDLLKKKANKK